MVGGYRDVRNEGSPALHIVAVRNLAPMAVY